MTFSLFPQMRKWPLFGPFEPKLTQIWPKWPKMVVFHIFFLKTAHWNFLIFCTKPSLWNRKNGGFAFFSKRQKWPILGQIWLKFWHFVVKKIFSPSFFKRIEKIISGKKSTFHHFYPLHDLPLPTQMLFICCFFPKITKKHFGCTYFMDGPIV